MDYSLFDQDGGLCLRMRGKFTHRDYKAFLGITDRMVAAGRQNFIFDLTEIEQMDSGAIGMLLMALDIANRHRIALVIKGAQGQVKTVITNAHLDELFILT